MIAIASLFVNCFTLYPEIYLRQSRKIIVLPLFLSGTIN